MTLPVFCKHSNSRLGIFSSALEQSPYRLHSVLYKIHILFIIFITMQQSYKIHKLLESFLQVSYWNKVNTHKQKFPFQIIRLPMRRLGAQPDCVESNMTHLTKTRATKYTKITSRKISSGMNSQKMFTGLWKNLKTNRSQVALSRKWEWQNFFGLKWSNRKHNALMDKWMKVKQLFVGVNSFNLYVGLLNV